MQYYSGLSLGVIEKYYSNTKLGFAHSFSRTHPLHYEKHCKKVHSPLSAAGQLIWEITLGPLQTTCRGRVTQHSLSLCQLICSQYFSQMLPGEKQFPDIFQMIFILPAGHSSGSTAWRTWPDGPIKDSLPALFGLDWTVWALPWVGTPSFPPLLISSSPRFYFPSPFCPRYELTMQLCHTLQIPPTQADTINGGWSENDILENRKF